MIIVNPRARAPYRAIYVTSLEIDFVEIPGVGIGAQVADDHPLAAAARGKALKMGHLVEGWDGDVLTVIPAPALPTVASLPLPSPAPTATAPLLNWAEELDAPPVIVRAARNGWLYRDATGAGSGNLFDERGGRGTCGLTAIQMSLSNPPKDWTPRVEEADPYPWEVPGWAAPPGFTAPSVRVREIAPPTPPPDPVDERFSDADEPPPDDGAHDAPKLEVVEVTDETKTATAAALVALGVTESAEQALLIIKAAVETPRAADGSPPPRGKVNLTLRNRKLPQLAESTYATILSIL